MQTHGWTWFFGLGLLVLVFVYLAGLHFLQRPVALEETAKGAVGLGDHFSERT